MDAEKGLVKRYRRGKPGAPSRLRCLIPSHGRTDIPGRFEISIASILAGPAWTGIDAEPFTHNSLELAPLRAGGQAAPACFSRWRSRNSWCLRAMRLFRAISFTSRGVFRSLQVQQIEPGARDR